MTSIARQFRDARRALRRGILDRIDSAGLSTTELAARLDLLPVGVEVLLDRDEWTWEEIARIGDAVGMRLKNPSRERGEGK